MYRFDAKLMAMPADINPARKMRMDPDGFGLATLIDDIANYDPELYLALRREFCGYFPHFKTIRVETENAIGRQLTEYGLYTVNTSTTPGKVILFETTSGDIVRARQASEGALLFLGFLALAYLPEPRRPKLLLIEEPEKGIYPKALDQIIPIVKRWTVESPSATTPQIVMSTHSPYVLSIFDPDQVTFLRRQEDGVHGRPLRDAPHIKERLAGGEFYLGELWYNLTEEELFGDVEVAKSS
jgi:hypothetical protein